jgi:hypothetical protein
MGARQRDLDRNVRRRADPQEVTETDRRARRNDPMRLLVLAVTTAVLLSACGDDQDPDGAKSLLSQVRAAPYQAWRRAPGYESRQKARAPHSDYVDIFINPVVAKVLDEGKPVSQWPVGSIIVKDGFDGDGDHEIIAIMEKRADGWFWAEYDGDGDSMYSGRPEICTDCHASGSDGVRAFALPR